MVEVVLVEGTVVRLDTTYLALTAKIAEVLASKLPFFHAKDTKDKSWWFNVNYIVAVHER